MPLKSIINDNKALFTCPLCGDEFEVDYRKPANDFEEIMYGAYEKLVCDECFIKRNNDETNARKEAWKTALISTLDERMKSSGFSERFINLEKPYIRDSAVWIWKNRFSNILVSGSTGTGKTSSVSFVVRQMLANAHINVKYYRTWQLFQAEFVKAKTTDGDNEVWFFDRIDKLDYLILDELVGKKGETKLSPTGQELLFNIVDGAYSQSRNTKIWLLGNFYAGAIDSMLDDPLPTKRRLQDSFKIAWFENGKPVDETMKIFDETKEQTIC